MKRFVCGFYRNGDFVLLLRKLKPEWQKGKFNGLGGHIEEGESNQEAMAREFREEAGQDTPAIFWTPKVILMGPEWEVVFMTFDGPVFLAPECNEGTLEWHRISTLPLDVLPNLNWMIPLCFDTTVIFPIAIGDSR